VEGADPVELMEARVAVLMGARPCGSDAVPGEGGDDGTKSSRQRPLGRSATASGRSSMCCSGLGFGWVKGC
jgi:hypothetical protein